MKTLQLEKLSENEMSLIKGGKWMFIDGEWHWVVTMDLKDDEVPPPPPPLLS